MVDGSQTNLNAKQMWKAKKYKKIGILATGYWWTATSRTGHRLTNVGESKTVEDS
jgi:hypothetical protein